MVVPALERRRLHKVLQQELPCGLNLNARIALCDFPFFLFCYDK